MSTVVEIVKSTKLKRVLFHADSKKSGPIVVFFAGIHGNEPAGVKALQTLKKNIQNQIERGQCFAIAGNIPALEKNKRYLEKDLNRLWTSDKIHQLETSVALTIEERQQLEIYKLLKEIINKANSPCYFIDIHTTSSESPPFITINDALINRKFSKLFPVPIVLGIEEFLSGPLLSYINSLGYISLGFEAGQHREHRSIKNSEAFISLVLQKAGLIRTELLGLNYSSETYLKIQCRNLDNFFEIIYTEKLKEGDEFNMQLGYSSFQSVAKGEVLATINGEEIVSPSFGRIFMPLYQKRGEEGFFIIKSIPKFFLWLSLKLRPFNLDRLMPLLPGVSWKDSKKECLIINTRIAFLFPRELFHLFGYRQRQMTKNKIYAYNRERFSKSEMYKREIWN